MDDNPGFPLHNEHKGCSHMGAGQSFVPSVEANETPGRKTCLWSMTTSIGTRWA
jgi:hypothetical protein